MSEPSPSGANPAATAAADPPLDPPGDAREVVRVVGHAERGVLGRRAHRELVEVRLGDRDRAGVDEVLARRWRCTAAASRRGSSTSTWWGCPACRGCPSARPARRRAGPGPRPRPTAASTASAAASASSRSTTLHAWSSRLAGVDRREVLLDDRRAARARRRPRTASPRSRRAVEPRSRCLPEDARARGTGRPRPPGACGEHLVAVERRPHLVGPQHVLERQRVRGRRDVVERERLDVGRVPEDARELARSGPRSRRR